MSRMVVGWLAGVGAHVYWLLLAKAGGEDAARLMADKGRKGSALCEA